MLGTGLFASSFRLSGTPSTTSNSCKSGTYCRQMGSPGALIRSTIAGEIRSSKFSIACCSRSRSGNCSGPNFSTSCWSEATLRSCRSFCQSAMWSFSVRGNQPLGVHDQVVVRRVEVRNTRRCPVRQRLVERTRRTVIRSRRRFHHHEPAAGIHDRPLARRHQRAADPPAVGSGVHGDPVKVPGGLGAGRGAIAGEADELIRLVERPERVVVLGGPGRGAVEHLQRDVHLRRAEHAGGAHDLGHAAAIARVGGPERERGGHDAHAVRTSSGGASAGRRRSVDRASSTMRRIKSSYDHPAACAMRDSPASSEISGLGFTSSTHGWPVSSTRRSTRPYPCPRTARHADSDTARSRLASHDSTRAGQTGWLPRSSGHPLVHLASNDRMGQAPSGMPWKSISESGRILLPTIPTANSLPPTYCCTSAVPYSRSMCATLRRSCRWLVATDAWSIPTLASSAAGFTMAGSGKSLGTLPATGTSHRGTGSPAA